MSQTWTATEIVQKYRDLTGLKSTSQRSDALCLDDINDYYQLHFPIESQLERFETDFVQQMLVSDDGDYLLDEDILEIKPPYTIDNFPTTNFSDKNQFDRAFPLETDPVNLIDPELRIGLPDSSKVRHGNFSYRIKGFSYSKSANVQIDLTGDTLPQDRYGAWRFDIASDGTITVVEANNAVGYDSAGQAVQALRVENADQAPMGFVTVFRIGVDFVPGTTDLDAGGVTSTFTDGYISSRSTPYAVMIDRRRFWVGPKPDGIHVFKATAVKRPDALTTNAPLDISWGIVIAYGATIIRKSEDDDDEALARLNAAKEKFMRQIQTPDLRQSSQVRAKPRF